MEETVKTVNSELSKPQPTTSETNEVVEQTAKTVGVSNCIITADTETKGVTMPQHITPDNEEYADSEMVRNVRIHRCSCNNAFQVRAQHC